MYANPQLIVGPGRRSVARVCNAVVDREEKNHFSLRKYPQLEILSCISVSLILPHSSLDDLFFCLFEASLSLSLSLSLFASARQVSLIRHSLTLSSQVRSSSHVHLFPRWSGKEVSLSNPRMNCSFYESITNCAH